MLKKNSNKLLPLLVAIFILSINFNTVTFASENIGDGSSKCYGFIIKKEKYDNETVENQVFINSRNLVNDLLRENITVYWTSENFTEYVSDIADKDYDYELSFEKGSFIVPFTKNEEIDSKISAIIYDYNNSGEIEIDNQKIPIYLLKRNLKIKSYKLTNTKIAGVTYFLECGICWYTDIISKCGFLNMDFIHSNILGKKLNNKDYNLLIWPGRDTYYNENVVLVEIAFGIKNSRNRMIRNFVANGGALVGSCYAANMVCRGNFPFPIYPKIISKNPIIPSIALLSLSDMISGPGAHIHEDLEQEIDTNHPVGYGVDSYLTGGFLLGGPKIIYAGESIETIGTYKNDSYVKETPSITSNSFGEGKVVVFSPHPEIRDNDTGPKFWKGGVGGTCNGKRLVTNAFYYSTSKDDSEYEISKYRNISFITEVFSETEDLLDSNEEKTELFSNIKDRLNDSITDTQNLIDDVNLVLEDILKLENDLNEENLSIDLYYGGVRFVVSYLELLNNYLKKERYTLEMLETVYQTLTDKENLNRDLEKLKNELNDNIEKAEKQIELCKKNLEDMKNILNVYKTPEGLRKIRQKIFKIKVHDIEKKSDRSVQYINSVYSDSLKLLRNYWYKYETSVCIDS